MRPTPWQARSGLSRGRAAWHQHVAVLLSELRLDDPALLAHLVLAPLAPDLVRHLTREVGASGERVRGEVRALAARVTA